MEGRPGFVIAGWCGSAECEAEIKAETQATLRNIPFGSEGIAGTCVKCGKPSIGEAWFAKAYEDTRHGGRFDAAPGMRRLRHGPAWSLLPLSSSPPLVRRLPQRARQSVRLRRLLHRCQ